MKINNVLIEDTYCEAFSAYFSRIIITAYNKHWLDICAKETTGYGTSTIHCDSEAGIDVYVSPEETPDNRPGVALMFFAINKKKMDSIMLNRIGQCVLTCPSTACFDGLNLSMIPESEFEIKTGYKLKFFGDKFEEKLQDEFPFEAWRIPVMDGEFVIQNTLKIGKGIAGGNFFIIGKDQASTLSAAEKAIKAMKGIPNLITPFPGGVVRAGSKVGSRYSFLNASTNDPLCPTLKDKIDNSLLNQGENCVYELILNGANEDIIKIAMRLGINAATNSLGILRISAGNYGGNLGKFKYNLHEILG
ncbi:MAG: formylmethanofuran--tetrahydromethanopterin N-formyltransferase [Candidatus Lokiarchaeota archaeon]|nr:formylmethanofuran--tetrahydromethanopterin N-formyltransferase [Candidatus Lokiarchaeota archaeon]